MKPWTTIILGLSLAVTACELEPPDSAGQGLSASGGGSSTGGDAPDGTTGSAAGTQESSSSSGETPGGEPDPEPGSTSAPALDDEGTGSSSGGWWEDTTGRWGSSSGGFLDVCTSQLDAASCEGESGCVWFGAGGEGVCLEDFGGQPGDLCGFLDAELCDVLGECVWDDVAAACNPV